MIREIVNRPIGVITSFIVALTFSALFSENFKFKLLPATVDKQSITIKIERPGFDALSMDKSITAPVIQELSNLDGLIYIDGSSKIGSSEVDLHFEQQVNLEYRQFDIQDEIDKLLDYFPNGTTRPKVLLRNIGQIPLLRLHIVPKLDLWESYEVIENILVKRFNQVDGISFIDINGLNQPYLSINLREDILHYYRISRESLEEKIKLATAESSTLLVNDGSYRYRVYLESKVGTLDNLSNIPVTSSNGQNLVLADVADISIKTQTKRGIHQINGLTAVVLSIYEESNSNTRRLREELSSTIRSLKTDYSSFDFHVTQDQSELLISSIENLGDGILLGVFFSFMVLWLAYGNLRSGLIVFITIPISLFLTLVLLHALDVSLNIISLSGLALGLGLLVDNSIIVVDSIFYRVSIEHNKLLDSISSGVKDVASPIIASSLTTLSIFLPLILLSDIFGALFQELALVLAVVFTVSLATCFTLIPVLYRVLKVNSHKRITTLVESRARKWHYGISEHVWRKKTVSLIVFFGSLLISVYVLINSEKSPLPNFDKSSVFIHLDWNEPISAEVNGERIRSLLDQLAPLDYLTDVDIGKTQDLYNFDSQQENQSGIFIRFKSMEDKRRGLSRINQHLESNYPMVTKRYTNPKNSFNDIFNKRQSFFRGKYRVEPVLDKGVTIKKALTTNGIDSKDLDSGTSLENDTYLKVKVDYNKALFLGIEQSVIKNTVEKVIGNQPVVVLSAFEDLMPVVFDSDYEYFDQKLSNTFVENRSGNRYPLDFFVEISVDSMRKEIRRDTKGNFIPISVTQNENESEELKSVFNKVCRRKRCNCQF